MHASRCISWKYQWIYVKMSEYWEAMNSPLPGINFKCELIKFLVPFYEGEKGEASAFHSFGKSVNIHSEIVIYLVNSNATNLASQ